MLNIFLILIFIRPFISSLGYPSFDTYYSVCLIVVSLVLIKSKKEFAQGFSGQGCLLLFFLAIILSAFFSLRPYKSIQELPKFISYFFIFYGTYYSSKLEKKKIILTLILSATCVSLFAIYWFYLGSLNLLKYINEQNIFYPFAAECLIRSRAFIPFALPGMLAGYLIMMLPLSLGYLIKEDERLIRKFSLKNALLALSILPIVIALLYTKSASAFLSIFLSLLIFIILSGHINERTFLVLSILLLALISIFILRTYKATLNWETPAFSIQNRFIYWRQAVSVILRYPFRGIGLGNFPFIRSKFVHNSYLQIWAEVGLLGIVSFLAFLYKSLKTIQPKELVSDKLYAGIVIANLSFLIHNLIDFSFFLPEVSISWWIIVALFLSSADAIQKT